MTCIFGYKLQEMSFTYLGLPMCTTRPRVEHYEPIMNRMERQLSSISSLLTHVGRLQLVNSVLSSSPTYTMCSVSIPSMLHDYFDKIRRHCMWRNSEMTEKANLWWLGGNVPSPKEGGGVWESSTSKAKTRPSSSSTWTSFIIKRTSHGLG
jgi:hypothetical protein